MARPTSQKTVVSRLFSASERPIYVLDAAGRIAYGNQALADWLAVPMDHLLGVKCVWSGEANNALNRLALPPHAKEHANYSTTITIPNSDEATHRPATFIALKDGDELGAWLVVLGDLETEEPDNSPFEVDGLHRAIQQLQSEWREEYKLDCIVGSSVAIKQVRSQVQVATQSFARCVVVGNVGSGRELIARTIYSERPTVQSQLAPLSCWLLDAEQMHKMLHEFVRHQKEMGDENAPVLLLLDVDELDVEAQLVLRGMLSESEFQWQILATSKTPLTTLADDGKFLGELAYALTDLEIRIPALSDRLDDIPLLAQWTLERSSHAEKRTGFAADAMESLLRYAWPREIEELKEVVNEAAATATTSQITKEDLPQKLKYAEDAAVLPDIEEEQIKLDDFLAEIEAELIARAIKRAKGNRAQAARSLGISRGKLLRRVEQLGVEDRETP